ncbi:hypothetical protein Glove_40g100 [Diversispora epigaea]|uniref:NodB homology domain-containing protein n=1 Tax=Diversispora epigaea TaxID=1348612 RepID=A0A397JFP7_9GLOM|nr:hypothetical protein Glove_40g100 [Diversispora epigaea]
MDLKKLLEEQLMITINKKIGDCSIREMTRTVDDLYDGVLTLEHINRMEVKLDSFTRESKKKDGKSTLHICLFESKGKPKCLNNLCCSQWGWCESTSVYCGTLFTGSVTTSKVTSSNVTSKVTTTTPKVTTTPSKVTTATATTPPKVTTTTTIPLLFLNQIGNQFIHWTNDLLDNLKNLNAKATFFINDNNWGCVYDYAPILKRIVADGHQLSHHMWGHLDLATLSREQINFSLRKILKANIEGNIDGKANIERNIQFVIDYFEIH